VATTCHVASRTSHVAARTNLVGGTTCHVAGRTKHVATRTCHVASRTKLVAARTCFVVATTKPVATRTKSSFDVVSMERRAESLERIRLKTEHRSTEEPVYRTTVFSPPQTPRLRDSVRASLLTPRPWRTWRAQPSGASATRAVGIPEGLLGDRVTTL
jgi:hypothetical protein